MRVCLAAVLAATFSYSNSAFAFEDAQTLPDGVRRAELKFFHSVLDSTTNSNGRSLGLGDKLQQDVTYEDFISVRSGNDKRQLQGFLRSNNIDEGETVGRMRADVKGAINVIAPTFGYGFSDAFSFGIAVPYYSAETDTKVAFAPNDSADEFVNLLAGPKVGLSHKANEAVDAINGVPDTLDDKLDGAGYKKIGRWNNSGLGDILIKGKYKIFDLGAHRFATDFGGRLPTGATDDPDVLTDIQFGDGTYDIFSGIMYDYRLGGLSSFTPFFINTFAKYTYQAPSNRTIRLKTAQENIEVSKKNVAYKLGDFIDTGVSLQLDTYIGVVGGVGYKYFYKFEDKYNAGKETNKIYEDGTMQQAHIAEAMFGYSSVNAFRRGTFAVPFTSYLVYERQVESLNMPVKHIYELDLKFFF